MFLVEIKVSHSAGSRLALLSSYVIYLCETLQVTHNCNYMQIFMAIFMHVPYTVHMYIAGSFHRLHVIALIALPVWQFFGMFSQPANTVVTIIPTIYACSAVGAKSTCSLVNTMQNIYNANEKLRIHTFSKISRYYWHSLSWYCIFCRPLFGLA